MNKDPKTLSQRLAGSRMPVADALRYALQISDALRRIHDSGSVHGSLTPETILLVDGGVGLPAARPEAENGVTPYTAPEMLQGQPPDFQSDIFAFGAILYEMLGGRRAFLATAPEALAEEIAKSTPPPVGQMAMDHVICHCL